MQPLQLSATLPELPAKFVALDNVVSTIESIFSPEIDSIIVEGRDGVGKTTILNAFARTYGQRSIVLFLRPQRISYDPSAAIAEIIQQASVLLPKSQSQQVSTPQLSTVIHHLATAARRANAPITFVIDGLAEVHERDASSAEAILELLPLGRAGFRFLFSGDIEQLIRRFGASSKAFPVTFFGHNETRLLFDDLSISESEILRIHKACNGLVGQMATIRRLMKSGSSLDAILDRLAGDLGNSLEMEWERSHIDDEPSLKTLALLAFDGRPNTIASISSLTSISEAVVEATVERTTFLLRSPNGTIEFISDNHRRFAQRKLERFRQPTLESLVSTLLQDLQTIDSVTRLPHLMIEAKQYTGVVDLMDDAYFARLANLTESISPVFTQAQLASNAAERIEDDLASYRFRMLQSAALQMLQTNDRRAEVGALVAIGDTAAALSLARASSFREQRLTLLATAAEAVVVRGEKVELAVIDELTQLAKSVDVIGMSDTDVLELASTLFTVQPETAIALIDRFTAETNRSQTLDWMFAAVSIHNKINAKVAQRSAQDFEKVYERIADPGLRALSRGLGTEVEKGADWILEQSNQIQDATHRITSLRIWLDLHQREPEAYKVALEALDTAVRTREYSVTLALLRQCASVLPYTTDEESAALLTGRIDALAASQPYLSPSVEYVRLQLLLARSQSKTDPAAARARLVDLYSFICDIPDIGAKAQCLARLYAWLPTLDTTSTHEDVRRELLEYVGECLIHSADHDEVVIPIVKPLVASHPALALQIAASVNTDVRRDAVRANIAEEMVSSRVAQINSSAAISVLNDIGDPRLRDSALIQVLRKLSRRKEPPTPETMVPFIALVSQMTRGEDRSLARGYAGVALLGRDEKFARSLMDTVVDDLKSISNPYARARAGYTLVREIARIDSASARKILDATQQMQEEGGIRAPAVNSFAIAMRLSIRALRGVIKSKRDCKIEVERIIESVQQIPDAVWRAMLLSELTFWLDIDGDRDDVRRAYESLNKVLAEVKQISPGTYWQCFALASGVIFRKHERFFNSEVKEAPYPERERIVRAAARSIMFGVPSSEPYENSPTHFRELSYKECTDLESLALLVDDDDLVYRSLRAVARSATQNSVLTREERTDVARRFEQLILTKLPCKNKIQHDGYKWASLAELMRMNDPGENRWRELVGWAAAIPNVADAAYTLILIASATPTRYSAVREKASQEACLKARRILISTERIDALANLSDEIRAWDPKTARELLKEATEIAAGVDYEPGPDRIERILDIAYNISPEFSLALSSELDSDPARKTARDQKQSARRVIEARKEMLDDTTRVLTSAESDSLVQAGWKNLGSLNSGTLSHRRPEYLRKSLVPAASIAIGRSYPIFAWAVQNWVERFGAEKDALRTRPMVHANLLSAEIIRSVGRQRRAVWTISPEDPADEMFVLIKAGERTKALEFARDWLRRTASEYVKIIDGYFGPDDLDIVKIIKEECPGCSVQILTSAKHLAQEKCTDPFQAFSDGWARLTPDAPPQTDIVVVSQEPYRKSPIHDRWWLTAGAGLDFGTSLNSLGNDQESKIRECTEDEARRLEARADQYLQQLVRRTDSGRLSYLAFSL